MDSGWRVTDANRYHKTIIGAVAGGGHKCTPKTIVLLRASFRTTLQAQHKSCGLSQTCWSWKGLAIVQRCKCRPWWAYVLSYSYAVVIGDPTSVSLWTFLSTSMLGGAVPKSIAPWRDNRGQDATSLPLHSVTLRQAFVTLRCVCVSFPAPVHVRYSGTLHFRCACSGPRHPLLNPCSFKVQVLWNGTV